MHIADGVIEQPWVLFGSLAVGAGSVVLASRRFADPSSDERAALVGVLGAFVFAAQMVNFPLGVAPVSAHLVGTGLLTVLLGPSTAIVTIAAVLLVQALLFQDGGLLAWGANVMALGVGGALPAAAAVRCFPRRFREGALAGFTAGVVAVLGSTAIVMTLLVTGTALDPAVVIGGLGVVQLGTALAEGGITAVSVVAIHAVLGPGSPTEESEESP